MSLSKQLLLLISALFLMIFSVNFVLSVDNIRSYLEGESQVHAQDTATSLGLSLSPYLADEKDPVLETMMNAIFDRGYYKEIKLVGVEGEPLVTLRNDEVEESVPEWFIALVPMETASADSEISSGWSISGVVSVAINPGYAYYKLYEQVITSFYYSLGAFALSVTLLLLVLQITLSSLKRIGRMAETIAQGNYDVIERLPWTSEVRRVAQSMNIMSNKIAKVIDNLNKKLERVGQKLQLDELTGLGKKSGFNEDMDELLASNGHGFVFLIKLDALSSLVKELGRDEVDIFIRDFAEILKGSTQVGTAGELSAYRIFGSEFILLARNTGETQAKILMNSLSTRFSTLAKKYHKDDIAHIGGASYDPFSSIDTVQLAATEAYEQAVLIGANSYYLRKGDDRVKDMVEWKELVFDVIDNASYRVSYLDPVTNLQSGELIMKEVFSAVSDKQGETVSIATFVSIAEKFVKIVDLDKGVTQRVVEYMGAQEVSHFMAINLSNRTIKNSDFRVWLGRLLTENQALADNLVFSLSAYAVGKEVAAYQEFIRFVQGLNAKVMIKRFETQSLSASIVKELKPDFIRLARNIADGIAKDAAKQDFSGTMVEIADLLNIQVLAENVQSDEDLAFLKSSGIEGASR
ncbi:GGDEF domain-containing protein [Cycloclasticus sp. 46_120_T64]|nr:GGDEF domain-containing protein [Cycloclasticus sp. 46_120_T64]